MASQAPAHIAALSDFWTREFAFYLHEHRNPLNRLTHMFGVPLLIVTGVLGLWWNNWALLVGGQVVGWAIQIAGHRIEGNRPALLKRPISFLMGPADGPRRVRRALRPALRLRQPGPRGRRFVSPGGDGDAGEVV
jgi:hypothetical protein